MLDQFSRTRLQFSDEGMERLFRSKVAVFGVGGVGGYCVEALVRAGIGWIDLYDDDQICLTNLNRQLIATHETVGQYKVDVMKGRALSINPDVKVGAHRLFYGPATADQIDLTQYDYIVDAIDTVTAKLELAVRAKDASAPLISSMGTGNKLDPTELKVGDIYSTSICPLARVMRRELRKRGIERLKVVYSREIPLEPREDLRDSCRSGCVCPPGSVRNCLQRRQIPSSNAFVPAAAGLIIAGEVIRDLAGRIGGGLL